MISIENRKMFLRKIKIKDEKFYISKLDKKVAKKLIKKFKKYNIKRIVCDKQIMKNEQFLNYLYAENIIIYNGKVLFKNIIKNIFDYFKENKIELEKMNVAILANENSKNNMNIIYLASNTFRSISIITNNSNKFRKIEKELEKDGITINISNNKKKSLKKVEFIINIDYPNELINKFNINENAIILNIEEKIKIDNDKFKGKNINNYEIDFENEFLEYEMFDKNLIYEAKYFENRSTLFTSRIKNKKIILKYS